MRRNVLFERKEEIEKFIKNLDSEEFKYMVDIIEKEHKHFVQEIYMESFE